MARRVRLQYEGAIYHVINRGNYRRDVFDTVGAAQAFEAKLAETCERHGWELHAYVIMRNHFHLALSTPQANLVEGMHWLQGTFAARFNRLRAERGHLFQGRYRALIVEDAAALARVVDYIHLNPVRAKILPGEQVRMFRWSSLRRYASRERPAWLVADYWLAALGLRDEGAGWEAYRRRLIELAGDPTEQDRLGFPTMSRGWAIGTEGWKKAVAKDHAHLALSPGLMGAELRAMKEVRWTAGLTAGLETAGKTEADAAGEPMSSPWKVALAQRLRHDGAPCSWIAERLKMGTVGSLRAYLYRANSQVTP